jgi:drug/metabolite transporter (DMT)-like permease
VPALALGLALVAAFAHAFWNLLIARAREVEAATAVALVAAVVLFAPLAAWTGDVRWRALPFVGASSTLHLLYFALLAAGYRRFELGVVYPVARGTAPVLVLLAGAALLGTGIDARQAFGVVLVGLGVLLVRGFRDADFGGMAAGLAVAACIAAYTLVDKYGIRHASTPAYLELALIAPALVYSGTVGARRGVGALRAELRLSTVLAGAAIFAAYGLTLAALRLAPAAAVAAVRETSVVIATALAAVVLGESPPRTRLVGAAVVVAGVFVLGA